MNKRTVATGIVMLVATLSAACNSWRGFGFDASGPEMQELRHVLALRPGMSVADVGAGNGQLTLALAADVGQSGHVFSTDIDPEALDLIRGAVTAAKLDNVTVVRAQARDSGLPANCCDAVILRRVYHHFTDPAETDRSLLRAVRAGGVLAVIDFPPMFSWLWPWPPQGVPENRRGHGVAAPIVVAEVTASGFELIRVIDEWPGRWPLASYCALFQKPLGAQDAHATQRLKDS